MTRILALSGSLRRDSLNTRLLRAARELAPAGVELDVRTLHGIPVYDGDVEAQGLPEAVKELGAAITAADALLISTPEYNHSIPGVLKNGLDWISRPSGSGARIFGGKPTAVIGATPGGAGTLRAQDALLHVLRAFGSAVWFGPWFTLSHADRLFDADGRLSDAATREQLGKHLAGFAAFVKHQQRP
ncbi:MAG: NAD(P)H-dependent oxidoreductase [Pelomonas sp.]|nr:NAD(P)H-dependent oxidoreductase [Roseateles sp.]